MTASCTLFGLLTYFPQYRDSLPHARLALRGAHRRLPAVSYPPIAWPVLVAVAAHVANHASRAMAIALLVAWDGFLRVGELLQLTPADIAFSSDSRLPLLPPSRNQVYWRKTKAVRARVLCVDRRVIEE